ncbi:TRAP transporter substrate-binding protein DctP [Alloalcanivorax sp. C16-1]|uniref:TRAP transporter substrate-binding protein DctP n=1 Tax=Alloalcanivorax sp. C16-1 TaxID=3390051 RepID=UPI003970E1D5
MTLKRTFSGMACSTLAALCLAGPATVFAEDADKEVIHWTLQAHLPPGSGSWQDSVVAVKERLYERTDGRLDIKLHSAGSLFDAKEIFPAVKRGVIEIGYTSPAYLMSYIPTAGLAFSVPGAFQNVWEAEYFWTHLGFESLIREEAREQGVHYFTDKLYPTEMVLKKPVESLEDFSALKIRSAGLMQSFVSEVGAAATYVPGPEIYQALSTGVVDGAHWGAAQEANALSLYEVAKYHVRPALGIGGVEAFIINDKALAALPEDIREIVVETLDEHFWERTNEYLYQETLMLKQLADTQNVKVIELPDDVQQRMWKVGAELRAEEAKKSDRAAEAVERLNGFLRSLGRID